MEHLDEKKLKFIEELADILRQDVVKMLRAAGSGHMAGPLGMADIFATLYFHVLRHDPKHPQWQERDRVVLSNGHICPILYAALAHAGYFPVGELETFRKINSRLQGHPHRGALPGVETTSGPLGSGLSQAIGMAIARDLNRQRHRVYCIMSDAEHQEGNTWEAVMYAGTRKLGAITAIVDRNDIQISGTTERVMSLEPFAKKYEAFGWHVLEIDGHNPQMFVDAVLEAQAIHERPTVVIAHTIPGKGVDFMENDYRWHGKAPNQHEASLALKALKSQKNKLLAYEGERIHS